MIGWWNGLTDLQRIFALVGIPATLVLVVQTILLLFGLGAGHEDGCDCGCDLDGDGIPDDLEGGSDDGLTLFSVRGIVAMFCIAGWSGIVFIDFGMGQVEAILLAVLCGVAALFGMECDVFMGAVDVERQAPNVERMKTLGARVIPVTTGSATLKDAMNEAIRNWVATSENTFYVIGTVAGPHPYPAMVKEFQSVIGIESRRQILAKTGKLPKEVLACVGGGSNAIGMFAGFLDDKEVKLTGVEAGGRGVETGEHAASICGGRVGVLHGCKTYLLQTDDGQIVEAYSVSAGLDYPGVGPEHSYLADTGRVRYTTINDDEAVAAFDLLSRQEGIIPALESSHAVAEALKVAKNYGREDAIIVCLSGRGDKDMDNIRNYKMNQEKAK